MSDNNELNYLIESLYNAYKGILANNQEFKDETYELIQYGFDCKEYQTLIDKYKLNEIAKNGCEFHKAINLLKYFAPKLIHKSDYDNHINQDSLSLLEHSLNKPIEFGINCLNKSKILLECCLALKIYARRVYILPYSPYDFDSHVVNEIFDTRLNKWIMLDMTTCGYYVNENNFPLSILEIRNLFALNQPCYFIDALEKNIEKCKHNNDMQIERCSYLAKNLFYLKVDKFNTFGFENKSTISFIPVGFNDLEREKTNLDFRLSKFKDSQYLLNKKSKMNELSPSKSCDLRVLINKPN